MSVDVQFLPSVSYLRISNKRRSFSEVYLEIDSLQKPCTSLMKSDPYTDQSARGFWPSTPTIPRTLPQTLNWTIWQNTVSEYFPTICHNSTKHLIVRERWTSYQTNSFKRNVVTTINATTILNTRPTSLFSSHAHHSYRDQPLSDPAVRETVPPINSVSPSTIAASISALKNRKSVELDKIL